MRHLKVKNIGPITEIDIELNKLNIFIGPQSSGKSTIIKIVCFCSWVEKRVALLSANQEALSKEDAFAKELVRFHKLIGYLQDESYIYYESDILKIEYHHLEKRPVFTWKKRFEYKKGKISYIPSERNIVATIPNWISIKFIDNSTRSFMSDWDEARNAYKEEKPLNVLNIGAKYFFDGEKDRVIVNQLNKEIELTNTSSGLQSLIPLLVLFDYLYDWIYHNENPESVKDIKDKNATDRELEQEVLKSTKDTDIQNETLDTLKRNFKEIHHTDAYLEEPEQNLFPEAQRDLVGELIRFNNLNENHSLTITTHSPYILSSINNLMYAYQMGKKDNQKANAIISKQCQINYDDVSAYFVGDGKVSSILDDEIKQIKAETIDEVSNILNKEYEDLLEIDN